MKSEMKYFDYDAGIASNQAVLADWNSATDFNGTPMVLTNYPTPMDTSVAAMSNATKGIMLINKVPQGTDIFERIGREITMTSLYLRIEIAALVNAWVTASPTVVNTKYGTGVRIMVLYDTQTNNVAESSVLLEQILKVSNNTGGGGGAGTYASSYMTAFQNLDYRDRWNVILDKVYDIGNSNGIQSRTIKIYKKFGKGGLPVIYTGNTGTTINTGALWFIIGGSQADSPDLVVSNAQQVQWAYFMTSRIRFKDS